MSQSPNARAAHSALPRPAVLIPQIAFSPPKPAPAAPIHPTIPLKTPNIPNTPGLSATFIKVAKVPDASVAPQPSGESHAETTPGNGVNRKIYSL